MTATDRDTSAAAPEQFQLSLQAAEQYEAAFVPAIFAEWAPLLTAAAGLAPGQTVLDVACGTGIVARVAADRLAGTGRVTGVDLNPGMLTVARRVRPDLDWREGDAADLPFDDDSFDTVLCQMALMFFPDGRTAVREMARVTRPGGTVALAVPAALEDQPANRPFVEAAVRHAGPEARALLGAYWSCGDLTGLCGLLTSAGLEVTDTWTHLGTARFASPVQLAVTEIEGSPLTERITPDARARILDEAVRVLQPWVASDGTLHAPLRGYLVAGRVR